jgi:hypothetical protein
LLRLFAACCGFLRLLYGFFTAFLRCFHGMFTAFYGSLRFFTAFYGLAQGRGKGENSQGASEREGEETLSKQGERETIKRDMRETCGRHAVYKHTFRVFMKDARLALLPFPTPTTDDPPRQVRAQPRKRTALTILVSRT